MAACHRVSPFSLRVANRLEPSTRFNRIGSLPPHPHPPFKSAVEMQNKLRDVSLIEISISLDLFFFSRLISFLQKLLGRLGSICLFLFLLI